MIPSLYSQIGTALYGQLLKPVLILPIQGRQQPGPTALFASRDVVVGAGCDRAGRSEGVVNMESLRGSDGVVTENGASTAYLVTAPTAGCLGCTDEAVIGVEEADSPTATSTAVCPTLPPFADIEP